MTICDNCGREVSHTTGTLIDGRMKWECNHCAGESGRVTLPSDQKLYLMHEVNPNEYEHVNGERRLKDWAQAELEAKVSREDPTELNAIEKAKERKRAQAREVRTAFGTRLSPTMEKIITDSINEGVRKQELSELGVVIPE